MVGVISLLFVLVMTFSNWGLLSRIVDSHSDSSANRLSMNAGPSHTANHKCAYGLLRVLMLADLELVYLLPWDHTASVLTAIQPARKNAYFYNAGQMFLQVAYLSTAGMTWASAVCMSMSAFSVVFRFVLSSQQRAAKRKVHASFSSNSGMRMNEVAKAVERANCEW